MMTERKTDTRLRAMANRLKLPFTRDHLEELLEAATTAKLTAREFLERVFSKEIEQRTANRFKQSLMAAHFPSVKTLDGFDLTLQPSIDPGVIRELNTLEWLEAGENVALFGPSGVGKTHLAIALGRLAVEKGYTARFYTAEQLLAILEKASKEDTLEAKLKELNKPHLLIIDEIGYLPYSPAAAHLLFRVVSRRYEKKSIITTSNRPPSEWGLIFADASASDAILDRLLHHCTAMTIRGDSYRLKEHRKAMLPPLPQVAEPQESATDKRSATLS